MNLISLVFFKELIKVILLLLLVCVCVCVRATKRHFVQSEMEMVGRGFWTRHVAFKPTLVFSSSRFSKR